MKVNNKGMTLVELIISFALVMVMVVGLYNLILEVKFQMDDKQQAKDLTQFSATLNNQIHYDLLRNNKKRIKALYVASDLVGTSNTNCFTGGDACTELSGYCNEISNCVVYKYGENDCKVIGLNTSTYYVGSSSFLKENDGIYYGDCDDAVFESIPIDNKYLFDIYPYNDKRPYVDYKDGNLIINYPIYLSDGVTKGEEDSIKDYGHNYGFKIVVPIG